MMPRGGGSRGRVASPLEQDRAGCHTEPMSLAEYHGPTGPLSRASGSNLLHDAWYMLLCFQDYPCPGGCTRDKPSPGILRFMGSRATGTHAAVPAAHA